MGLFFIGTRAARGPQTASAQRLRLKRLALTTLGELKLIEPGGAPSNGALRLPREASVRDALSLILTANGELREWIGTCSDITDQKVQEGLRQAMEAIQV